jgi:hypothetical protein
MNNTFRWSQVKLEKTEPREQEIYTDDRTKKDSAVLRESTKMHSALRSKVIGVKGA